MFGPVHNPTEGMNISETHNFNFSSDFFAIQRSNDVCKCVYVCNIWCVCVCVSVWYVFSRSRNLCSVCVYAMCVCVCCKFNIFSLSTSNSCHPVRKHHWPIIIPVRKYCQKQNQHHVY